MSYFLGTKVSLKIFYFMVNLPQHKSESSFLLRASFLDNRLIAFPSLFLFLFLFSQGCQPFPELAYLFTLDTSSNGKILNRRGENDHRSRPIPRTLEQTDSQLMQISPCPHKDKYSLARCNYFSKASLKLHIMEMGSIRMPVPGTQAW